MKPNDDKYLAIDLNMFHYDNGKLYWAEKRGNRIKPGDRAGGVNSYGYRVVFAGKKLLLEHRIIFLMHNEYLPACIDHINDDKADNRIENLREVTYSQNCINKGLRADNTTGVKNVTVHGNKYRVTVNINGKNRNFGTHSSLEFADLVAHEVREKYHGAYARHGV